MPTKEGGNQAHIFNDVGNYKKALQIFAEIDGNSNFTQEEIDSLILARSNSYSQSGRSTEAIDGYTLLTDRNPKSEKYNYLLCSELLRDGDSKSAISPCSRASTLAIDNGLYQMAHGVALFRTSDFGTAETVFLEAQDLRPKSLLIQMHLARIIHGRSFLGWRAWYKLLNSCMNLLTHTSTTKPIEFPARHVRRYPDPSRPVTG